MQFIQLQIARQHAMHPQRDIVLPILSVSPSFRPMPHYVYKNGLSGGHVDASF